MRMKAGILRGQMMSLLSSSSSTPVSRFSVRPFILLIIASSITFLFVVCRLPHKPILPRFRSAHLLDQDSIRFWADHVARHPVRATDRYGLKEMGFRTFIYAEMLRSKQRQIASDLQANLFPFYNDDDGTTSRTIRRRSLRRLVAKRQKAKAGIVISASNHTLVDVFSLVDGLQRIIKTQLPIEIFLDSSFIHEKFLERLRTRPNVSLYQLDALTSFDSSYFGLDEQSLNTQTINHAHQALALLSSSFTDLIYLSPDAVLLEKPEALLQTAKYQRTGTLFFQDAQLFPQTSGRRIINLIRRQLDRSLPSPNLAGSSYWNFEKDTRMATDVFALNKARPGILASLLLNAWMHTKQSRSTLWDLHYRDALGEMLWMSFELAQVPYSFTFSSPGSIGTLQSTIDPIVLDPAICEPRPLHFINRSRGGNAAGRPMWFKGPALADKQAMQFFPADAIQGRVKWEPTNGRWCTFGSEPNSLSEAGLNDVMIDLHRSTTRTAKEFYDIADEIEDDL